MDGNIFVTISFIHQNQGEFLLHIAILIKGSPTEVHRAQGQMKEIQSQRVLQTPRKHCPASSTLCFTFPLTLHFSSQFKCFGRALLPFALLAKPCWLLFSTRNAVMSIRLLLTLHKPINALLKRCDFNVFILWVGLWLQCLHLLREQLSGFASVEGDGHCHDLTSLGQGHAGRASGTCGNALAAPPRGWQGTNTCLLFHRFGCGVLTGGAALTGEEIAAVLRAGTAELRMETALSDGMWEQGGVSCHSQLKHWTHFVSREPSQGCQHSL